MTSPQQRGQSPATPKLAISALLIVATRWQELHRNLIGGLASSSRFSIFTLLGAYPAAVTQTALCFTVPPPEPAPPNSLAFFGKVPQ